MKYNLDHKDKISIPEIGQVYISKRNGPMLVIKYSKRLPEKIPGFRNDIMLVGLDENELFFLYEGREEELEKAEYTLTVKV